MKGTEKLTLYAIQRTDTWEWFCHYVGKWEGALRLDYCSDCSAFTQYWANLAKDTVPVQIVRFVAEVRGISPVKPGKEGED